MHSTRYSARARRIRRLLLALMVGSGAARAEPAHPAVDTEHLFGFITGTDVGMPGEVELESETLVRSGKQSGRYTTFSQRAAIEHVPRENLRLEFAAIGVHNEISSVGGLDDLRHTEFQGLSFEARYRLIDRQQAGYGLTLLAEPHWARIDEASGQRATVYGAGLAILADKELIRDRLIGAFNLLYEPETVQSRVTSAWSHEAVLGIGGGLMAQLWPGFLAGVESRYLRAYESMGPSNFSGHALFVGPTLYYRPSEHWRITASWSLQVAGRAVDAPGSALDLVNFSRHQARLRVGYHF